jgi:hypothetical protein
MRTYICRRNGTAETTHPEWAQPSDRIELFCQKQGESPEEKLGVTMELPAARLGDWCSDGSDVIGRKFDAETDLKIKSRGQYASIDLHSRSTL